MASPIRSRSKASPRGAAIYALKAQRTRDEADIEDLLCRWLERGGISYERQVATPCGIADVVTENTVYEVKNLLTREMLFKAFGQVTLYADALGKPRRVIVGYRTKTTAALCEAIRRLGVEIRFAPRTQPTQCVTQDQ